VLSKNGFAPGNVRHMLLYDCRNLGPGKAGVCLFRYVNALSTCKLILNSMHS